MPPTSPPLPPPSLVVAEKKKLMPTNPADLLEMTLEDFYGKYNPTNMSKLPQIIVKFSKRKSELWLQLCLKYGILPAESKKLWDGLNVLMDDPFSGDPFRFAASPEEVKPLVEAWNTLQESETVDTKTRGKLFEALLHPPAGSDAWSGHADRMLRVCMFAGGCPDDYRPAAWRRTLLTSEDSSDLGGKRDVYNQYKTEFLPMLQEQEAELYSQIVNDVDRTRQDMAFFHRPDVRESLISILVVYAKLNPGVKYVQGMNEVVAPIYFVFLNDSDRNSSIHAEADTFWCFTNLLSEVEEKSTLKFSSTKLF